MSMSVEGTFIITTKTKKKIPIVKHAFMTKTRIEKYYATFKHVSKNSKYLFKKS